jgi:cytochrome P450 / NADPH-cytochrome P450 reductase
MSIDAPIGTLSFATYYLLKNPSALSKLRAEIDEVIGDNPLQYQDLSQMPYLQGALSPQYTNKSSN